MSEDYLDRRERDLEAKLERLYKTPDEIQLYEGIPIRNSHLYYTYIVMRCSSVDRQKILDLYDVALHKLKREYSEKQECDRKQKLKWEEMDKSFNEYVKTKPEYNNMNTEEKKMFKLDWRADIYLEKTNF